MIDLGNRKILDDGTVVCLETAIAELIYQNKNLQNIVAEQSETVELHNKADKILDTHFGHIETFDQPIYDNIEWMNYWFTPEQYKNIDITALCLEKCKTQNEAARVLKELDLFSKKGMIPVLKQLVYMVDYWRSKNILWGVGRGSSVSSFVLYLIGINRINPMEWGLEIEDFLK